MRTAPLPTEIQRRLDEVVDLMREMSRHTDPGEMVRSYGSRARAMSGTDGLVSLSRRDMPPGTLRVTRSSHWKDAGPDAWNQTHLHPVLDRGLLVDLLYAQAPVLVQEFQCPPDDPAYEYLRGARSILAIPHFDRGEALNMVVLYRTQPGGFDVSRVPETVWTSNLFGRATGNLVLSRRLEAANAALDREMRVVADIQRSLLPVHTPSVPGIELAAYYQTSQNAGGDYYDFFTLDDGRLGVLIADVSGHGTPAAVLMAILHAIAHLNPSRHEPPSRVLAYINDALCSRYTLDGGMFVTAFYGVYDPARRTLEYCSAGHNPPRLRVGFKGEHGPVLSLDRAQGLPLGVLAGAPYDDATITLDPGDAVVLYTDGFTEAWAPDGSMFGEERLDQVIARAHPSAQDLLDDILQSVDRFANGQPQADDRTLVTIVAKE